MENTPILETLRLRLRKFTTQDLDDLLLIYGDEKANRFLPWFPVKNRVEAEQLFQEKYEREYGKPRGYFYAVCKKADDRPIGYVHVSMDDSYDLGYGLREAFWHQGIAAEAAGAVLEQLNRDGIPYVTATHDVKNPGSGAVMKKLGMKYQYSYEEQWMPKNIPVTFRMYQKNLKEPAAPIYLKYWKQSNVHFVEEE